MARLGLCLRRADKSDPNVVPLGGNLNSLSSHDLRPEREKGEANWQPLAARLRPGCSGGAKGGRRRDHSSMFGGRRARRWHCKWTTSTGRFIESEPGGRLDKASVADAVHLFAWLPPGARPLEWGANVVGGAQRIVSFHFPAGRRMLMANYHCAIE